MSRHFRFENCKSSNAANIFILKEPSRNKKGHTLFYFVYQMAISVFWKSWILPQKLKKNWFFFWKIQYEIQNFVLIEKTEYMLEKWSVCTYIPIFRRIG